MLLEGLNNVDMASLSKAESARNENRIRADLRRQLEESFQNQLP